MKLIDADALMDEANSDGAYGYVDAKQISEAPTIDAVPVVRCENCKYGYPCGDEIVCYHPEYELAEGKWSYKKDFFCAFGETKEGADNG